MNLLLWHAAPKDVWDESAALACCFAAEGLCPLPRLSACVLVQRHLWAAGVPCPEPLAGPVPLGTPSATAEVLIEGGSQLAMTDESPRLCAEALVRLVNLAPPVATLPSLEPSLPWVGWDHDQQGDLARTG